MRNTDPLSQRVNAKRSRQSPKALFEALEGRTLWSVSSGAGDLDMGRFLDVEPVTTPTATAQPAAADLSAAGAPGFQIQVVFPDATLTPSQQAVFTSAAARWQQVITGDVPDVTSSGTWGGPVDDVRIQATAPAIDGPNGILGQAGPRNLRGGSSLPFFGVMQFDSADVAALEQAGQLDEVILHEMSHVLGFGTIWDNKGLRTGAGGADPRYTGPAALAEYNAIFGTSEAGIPLENTGGAGTRDSHWRESTFDNELITGFLNGGRDNPMSRVTAAQFIDLGYTGVDVNAADLYTPPGGGNPRPVIASLTATPSPVAPGMPFVLSANGVTDNSGVASVKFYRENNGLPGLQTFGPGGDTLLSTVAAGPYTAAVSTAGLSLGTTNTYYAQATDNQGLNGAVASTAVTIAQPVVPSTVTGVYVDSDAWAPAFRSYLANNGLGSFAFGLSVPGGAAQLQTIPFVNVNQVSVQFSAPVSVQPTDLSVRGVNVASYATTTFSYDATTNTATWTLAAPLRADRVLLDLDGETANGVTASAGGALLDGEWVNADSEFPSGNGSAGGDFRFQFNALPGDTNRDGRVTAFDTLDARARQFAATTTTGSATRGYNPFADVDGSGRILSTDFALVRAHQSATLPSGSPSLAAPAQASFASSRITVADRDPLAALLA